MKKIPVLKRIILIFCAVFMVLSTQAQAGQTDTVTIKVTVMPSISVNIAEDSLSLGSIAAGGTSTSTTAVTISNNGSGINETYSLSLANPAGWTASQSTPGAETFVLNAAFSNAVEEITWDPAKHALSTAPVACSDTIFAAGQTGVNVPYNAQRKLWFQFKAPNSTTVNTEQDIVITVTAQAS